MTIKIAVPKETMPGELRVALDPSVADRLVEMGAEVAIQSEAGINAHFPDENYAAARIVTSAQEVLEAADVMLKVQPPTAEEIAALRAGAVAIGFMQPHTDPQRIRKLREARLTSLAMEFIPRITRAQAMDALSSQAAVAGYKAALMAAELCPRFFPMLTTAAGTIRPSKVLVIGAGVAGLQAIATARRLGAQVEAYDIRPAAKEEVESLGAKLIDTGVRAEGEGGYARELTEEEKQQQATALAKHLSRANVVISTAAVPGRPAPKIISSEMVDAMLPGAVIIDLAAETGGNCGLTEPGKSIEHQGKTISGPLNLASKAASHASEMYARNLFNLLKLMIQEGELSLNFEDEIIAACTLTHEGEIKHEATRKFVEGAA